MDAKRKMLNLVNFCPFNMSHNLIELYFVIVILSKFEILESLIMKALN